MASMLEHHSFIDEFKQFMKFLQTLWGILAGISIFFPLSNILLKVIPLNTIRSDTPGALYNLSPALVTTLATVVSLFVILATYRQRDSMKTQKQRAGIQNQAWTAFGLGAGSLILYFITYFGIYSAYYLPAGVTSDDPRTLIGDLLLLIFYAAFFALLTRAFILLAMLEYFNKPER